MQALGMLQGRWKLVYTSNNQTLLLLNALRRIPFAGLGEVFQTIAPDGLSVSNTVRSCTPRKPKCFRIPTKQLSLGIVPSVTKLLVR